MAGPVDPEEERAMYKNGKSKKNAGSHKMDKGKAPKSISLGGRDIIRRDEQFRIAPKHPGMGRR